jgi:hypothetical protein
VASEKRTRVEIFLPIRSDTSIYKTVTDWFSEELALVRGGSTLTAPFTGLFTSPASRRGVTRDKIQILFCDLDLDVEDASQRTGLLRYLDDVRLVLMEILGEEDIWITYHPVTRIL